MKYHPTQDNNQTSMPPAKTENPTVASGSSKKQPVEFETPRGGQPAPKDKKLSNPLAPITKLATSDAVVIDGELTWTRSDNGKEIDWNGANKYCEDLTVAGLSRWRLPTIDELEKLYDPKDNNKYYIRRPFRLTNFWVWSSTRQGSGSAFSFLFGSGERLVSDLGASQGVRALCVRGSGE